MVLPNHARLMAGVRAATRVKPVSDAVAEDAMAHTAIAIANKATNPTSMVIGVWFPWICFTFVAAFILTRHPFSLA